jgi:hypothetical protein
MSHPFVRIGPMEFSNDERTLAELRAGAK